MRVVLGLNAPPNWNVPPSNTIAWLVLPRAASELALSVPWLMYMPPLNELFVLVR